MTALTDRLDEWAALAEKATPGPWQVGWGDPDDSRSWVAFLDVEGESGELAVTASGDVGSTLYCEPDAALIAASRTAVPTLVEALRAVLAACDEPRLKGLGGTPDAVYVRDLYRAIASALGVEP